MARRAEWVAVLAFVVVLLLETSAMATAPLHVAPYCAHAGAISPDFKYESSPPWLISISHRATVNIARRAGYFEGSPATLPRYVPCKVAQSVAVRAIDEWENWSGNSGWISVGALGATKKPYLGRFYCTGQATHSGGAIETCTHRADQHAAQIVVRFTIRPASA